MHHTASLRDRLRRYSMLACLVLAGVGLELCILASVGSLKTLDPASNALLAQILKDPTGLQGIDDVTDGTGFFRPMDGAGQNLGWTESTWWIRFRLDRDGEMPGTAETCTLEVSPPYLRTLDLYSPISEPNGTKRWKHQIEGRAREGAPRSTGHPNPLLVLPPTSDNGWHYLRLESDGVLDVRLRVWSQQALARHIGHRSFLQGMLCGLMAAVVTITFYLYARLRERVYLYGLAYLLLLAAWQASILGHLAILWDLHPAMGPCISMGLITCALSLIAIFNQAFLETRSLAPWLDNLHRSMVYVPWFVVLLIALGFFNWSDASLNILSLVVLSMCCCAGWLGIRRGFSHARYYLAAWVVMAASGLLCIACNVGLLPELVPTESVLPLGVAVHGVFMCIALASRFSHIKEEKEAMEERERRFQVLSITDELTNLRNRRYFNSRLESEVFQAHRLGQRLVLAIADVDHFKRFNDTWGHPHGDLVLHFLGRLLRRNSRETDAACRIGGEEFALILSFTRLAEARRVVERVRIAFSRNPFDTSDGGRVACTLSFGVAELRPGEDATSLVARADAALYEAKNGGRDRTVVAESKATVS